MTRIKHRPRTNAAGNQTDEAVISTTQLNEFMRPMFFAAASRPGWSGWATTRRPAGADVFAVEDQLLDRVLAHFKQDTKQFTVHRKG